MYTNITVLVKDFFGLIFPSYCFGCNGPLVKGEDTICTKCILELPKTDYHLEKNNSLRERLALRFNVDFALAFFKFAKKSRVQRLLHVLKYKNEPALGVYLGKIYGEKLKASNYCQAFDLVLPVPLHPLKKKTRGYNQSAKFAEGLAEILTLEVSDNIIERTVKTETQTRKTKLKRWFNVAEVFHVKHPEKITGKRILLIDDVITTGATVEACAAVLINAACASISVACIAEA